MKVAILAGGLGSRLAEETDIKPKPMVEVGNQPILWHIMKHYAHHDLNEFVIALGYKGEYIKRWMVDYVRWRRPDRARPRRQRRAPRRRARRLDHLPGRHRAADGHRRADQAACSRTWATRPSCSPGVTASPTSTSARCSPSTGRTASSPRSPRCGPRPASGTSSSRATRSRSSPRSPRPARAGSTAPSSCWSPRCSTTSTVTTPSGSASRWSTWPRTAS